MYNLGKGKVNHQCAEVFVDLALEYGNIHLLHFNWFNMGEVITEGKGAKAFMSDFESKMLPSLYAKLEVPDDTNAVELFFFQVVIPAIEQAFDDYEFGVADYAEVLSRGAFFFKAFFACSLVPSHVVSSLDSVSLLGELNRVIGRKLEELLVKGDDDGGEGNDGDRVVEQMRQDFAEAGTVQLPGGGEVSAFD